MWWLISRFTWTMDTWHYDSSRRNLFLEDYPISASLFCVTRLHYKIIFRNLPFILPSHALTRTKHTNTSHNGHTPSEWHHLFLTPALLASLIFTSGHTPSEWQHISHSHWLCSHACKSPHSPSHHDISSHIGNASFISFSHRLWSHIWKPPPNMTFSLLSSAHTLTCMPI